MSTTMAFVRMLGGLLKAPELGARVVPIVADEARTFGMANLFKQVGIYSSVGQRYAPEDIGSVLSYREATDGQILEEGISEAGAIASWTAAATSYSVHGLAMLPFYIYYSMFGFQRVGDQIWAAADQRPRGFLLGATSGRTTLGGEGLQHQDGTSHLVAATIPNCKAYDPGFAGEMAVIIDAGMREMLVEQRDVFYYVTLMNENYAQPSLPAGCACRGAARLLSVRRLEGTMRRRQGAPEAHVARLRRDPHRSRQGRAATRGRRIRCRGVQRHELERTRARWPALRSRLRPARREGSRRCHSSRSNSRAAAVTVVAATDYVRAVPESVRAFLPARAADMSRSAPTDSAAATPVPSCESSSAWTAATIVRASRRPRCVTTV